MMRWTVVSNAVLRELTLKNSSCLAAFQLTRCFLDEYLAYIILQVTHLLRLLFLSFLLLPYPPHTRTHRLLSVIQLTSTAFEIQSRAHGRRAREQGLECVTHSPIY